MTAYGRSVLETPDGRVVVEIQSLNRKFLDIVLNLPKEFNNFDAEIRKWVGLTTSRGQITVRVSAEFTQVSPFEVRPNIALAKQLKSAWDKIAEELDLKNESFPVNLLIQEKELFLFEENSKDRNSCLKLLKESVEKALASLNAMKATEGAALQKDILSRLHLISTIVEEIEPLLPDATEKYRQKLLKRIGEVCPSSSELYPRILQEVALFAEKTDVSEEMARLVSHISQFRSSLESHEPIGKTLEFLLQELFREVNTLTTKVQDGRVIPLGLKIKGELEKIREQIQNIE